MSLPKKILNRMFSTGCPAVWIKNSSLFHRKWCAFLPQNVHVFPAFKLKMHIKSSLNLTSLPTHYLFGMSWEITSALVNSSKEKTLTTTTTTTKNLGNAIKNIQYISL